MPPSDAQSPRHRDTVVVGASAGGIDALSSLLRASPHDLPAAVLIVLHIATDAGGLLPRLLAQASRLPVRTAEDGRPESLRLETSMTRQLQPDEIPAMDRIGKLSPYTCPSCHGSLWEIFDEHVLRFRCHTGHAFSAPSLGDEIDVDVEDALFGALRALEENARLSRTIAERSRTGKRDAVATIYDDKASECERNADVIRNLLHRSQMARTDAD